MTFEARTDPVASAMHRVRIIPPADPRHAMLALAYGIEIDGHPVHAETVDVHFGPGLTPIITISLPAIVENAEILGALRLNAIAFASEPTGGTDETDEPPFLREEC